ncbi:MAG: hypothetical protein OJI67_18810 [Prosthecobacter sp.]|nr:hypothetical protein [Prosthecobacter sp.]
MKITLAFFSFLLACCCSEIRGKQDSSISIVYSTILSALTSKVVEKDVNDLYGAWQSESSNTLILIDKHNKAVVLNVVLIGDAELLSDGGVQISRRFPSSPSSAEVYGVLHNGRIVRQKYDYAEFFNKKGMK